MTKLPNNEQKEDMIDAGPGRAGQVIRVHPSTGKRHLDLLRWGLLPHNTPDPDAAPRPIHARAETVAELPMFADAFRHRRAIVPATEFYQRRTIGGPNQRFAISRQDGRPLAIAGLWESYRWPDGKIERTYCIITVDAVGPVAAIHNRMPLVLEDRDWPIWLGEAAGDPERLLHPPPGDIFVVRPVGGPRPRDRRRAQR